jgi:alkylation response protein AidB-like acyl-CoA dehydrogenase
MDISLPGEVVAFGEAAQHAFERLGAVDLARRALVDDSVRDEVGATLGELGINDLDVRADLDQLLAGAVLARSAGAHALPFPVVPDLLRIAGRRLALVDPTTVRIDHGDLPGGWIAADIDGNAWDVVVGKRLHGVLSWFVVRADLGETREPVSPDDVARWLVLGSWLILGAAERAAADAFAHVQQRVQFGRPLADQQAVRFMAADMRVTTRATEELAKFTTWRLTTASPAERIADAMALRLKAVESGRVVIRNAHQLYGAVGFCDETDVSIIDRAVQPTMRYPCSPEILAERLFRAVRTGALVGRPA